MKRGLLIAGILGVVGLGYYLYRRASKSKVYIEASEKMPGWIATALKSQGILPITIETGKILAAAAEGRKETPIPLSEWFKVRLKA